MEFFALLDRMIAIMKQSGPEVPFMNDFLGTRHSREVTTYNTDVEIIQDSIDFINGKTSSKYGIYPMSIENVSDEEVSGGLMVNAWMIISRDMRPKLICAKVYEEVSIPCFIGGYEEEVFIREILINRGRFGV
jgi:hypothetical protein